MRQRYGGLGLGLFIAKGLTEAQGGTLTVTSEGRGRGATFEVTLKVAQPAEPPAKAPAPPPPDHLRILLVEDHADTRAVLARLLEHQGHTVFTAQDTASALRLAETCEAELLISDIGLPDGTGYELMERLRLARPSLAGIALSGFGMPSDRDQSREAGFAEQFGQTCQSRQPPVRDSRQPTQAQSSKRGNLSPKPVIAKRRQRGRHRASQPMANVIACSYGKCSAHGRRIRDHECAQWFAHRFQL
jgi:CheY-like chemotaxis protein